MPKKPSKMPMLLLCSRATNKDSGRRTYKIVNWVILGLMLYLAALPFLSPLLEKGLPSVWGVCVYREILSRPCPLCGATRGVVATLHGDFHKAVSLNPLSIFAVLFVVSEAIFRAALLYLNVSPQSRSLLIRMDILVHVLLTGVFVCYIIKFVCKSFFT